MPGSGHPKKGLLAMVNSDPPIVSRRRKPISQGAVKGHTVTRYKLRLVKEDEETVGDPETLVRPVEMAAFLWNRVFEGLDREVVCGAYVDGMSRVIGWTIAYVGCLSRCSVEPRGLIVPALLANATGLIIVHNHPSGKLEPSAEDLFFTRRMVSACELLGLELIDSLIIAEGRPAPRWTSLKTVMG
jgi:DNA repair protein RadC